MERTYADGKMNDKGDLFIGIEVETSPTTGMRTLFIDGLVDQGRIKDAKLGNDIHALYFGANHSFQIEECTDWSAWEDMITPWLKLGYPCTLDIDVQWVEGLCETTLVEHRNFIPMISVKLPYADQLGYNAIIKIDDKDFGATNHGVWTHYLRDLQTRESFTPWSAYKGDELITQQKDFEDEIITDSSNDVDGC